jgi:hypothetical protein
MRVQREPRATGSEYRRVMRFLPWACSSALSGYASKDPRRDRARNCSSVSRGQGLANSIDGGQLAPSYFAHQLVDLARGWYDTSPLTPLLAQLPVHGDDTRQVLVVLQLLSPGFLCLAHCASLHICVQQSNRTRLIWVRITSPVQTISNYAGAFIPATPLCLWHSNTSCRDLLERKLTFSGFPTLIQDLLIRLGLVHVGCSAAREEPG